MCMNRIHAMTANFERFYVPYQGDGRGLMNLAKEYKTIMVRINKHRTHKDEILIKALLKHQTSKALHSAPKRPAKCLHEAETTHDMPEQHPMPATLNARIFKRKYKRDYMKVMREPGQRS